MAIKKDKTLAFMGVVHDLINRSNILRIWNALLSLHMKTILAILRTR